MPELHTPVVETSFHYGASPTGYFWFFEFPIDRTFKRENDILEMPWGWLGAGPGLPSRGSGVQFPSPPWSSPLNIAP